MWKKSNASTAKDAILFRELTDAEEEKMRVYARDHEAEIRRIWTISHPVCRNEILKRDTLQEICPDCGDNRHNVSPCPNVIKVEETAKSS